MSVYCILNSTVPAEPGNPVFSEDFFGVICNGCLGEDSYKSLQHCDLGWRKS